MENNKKFSEKKFNERFEQAIQFNKQGMYDEAISIFDSLTKEKPNQASIFGMLAYSYWQKQDIKNTIKTFKISIQLSPLSESASLGLFHALWEAGQRNEALVEVKRFISSGGKSKDYDEILKEINSEPQTLEEETQAILKKKVS